MIKVEWSDTFVGLYLDHILISPIMNASPAEPGYVMPLQTV